MIAEQNSDGTCKAPLYIYRPPAGPPLRPQYTGGLRVKRHLPMEGGLRLWSSLPIRPEIRSNTGGTIESFEQRWTQILAKDAYPAFRRRLAATQQVSNFLAEFAHPRANSANTLDYSQ